MQSKCEWSVPKRHALTRRWLSIGSLPHGKHLLRIIHFTPFFPHQCRFHLFIKLLFTSECAPTAIALHSCAAQHTFDSAFLCTIAIHQYCLWWQPPPAPSVNGVAMACNRSMPCLSDFGSMRAFSVCYFTQTHTPTHNSCMCFVLCVSHLPSIFTSWIMNWLL